MHSTLDGLADWIVRQSWYAGSPDGIARLRELAEVFLPSQDPTARVRIILVRDESPATPVLYQLPLVERDVADPAAPGLIGAGYGGVALLDGPTDPAFAPALLGGLRETGELRDPADDRYVVSCALVEDGADAVLRIEPYGRAAIEARIPRRVLDGSHPDAVAAIALADAGDPTGPRLVGVLPIAWSEDDGPHAAHLAVLTEATGSDEDGWARFSAAARRGDDAAADARELGRAIARMHAALGELGRRPATPDEIVSGIEARQTRLRGAVGEVPGLASRADRIAAVYDSAAALVSHPELQTVHGALELARTRRAADGGWTFHDHGAGDARPAEDRADLALRDVAGALRSLGYAGALSGASAAWTERVRRALLDGYAEIAGDDALPAVLLDALEADYAVLDAIWEARTRPAGVRIPLDALDRIAARALDDRDAQHAA